MARSPRISVITALAAATLFLVTACGGGPPQEPEGSGDQVAVRDGGEIVIGAEQEPDCADWLGTCSGSIWGNYTM